MNILLEHSKAGRVIGAKGTTIQGIKNRSGCYMMRLQKDPVEIYGILLRMLNIEGHLSTVKRAHQQLQEIYYGESASSTFFDGGGPANAVPVPINSLTAVGLQPETVKQLIDMKQYLATNFGLEMSISAIPGQHSYNVLLPGRGFDNHQGGGKSSSSSSDFPINPDDVQFLISKEICGGIIGKGGQGLKELQHSFGLKIFIEREVVDGMRNVILSGGEVGMREKCRDRIMEMSNNPMYLSSNDNTNSNNNNNDISNDMNNNTNEYEH